MPGEVKLKPCPFCGSAVGISHSIGDFWVKCFPCGASGGVRKDEESAIADWNRRAPEPGTSVIRWTRYDGTTETLPEIGAEILLKHGKSVIVVISQCVGADSYLAIWRNPPFVPERGDLWAYLPEPTEGMK